mmetsp:Transcript_14470/g.32007  ORF Transcript_14470/g.32007 Transcript_14470/m.32007 type:complete len:206 (-) Transcript_14470:522-1139(-)
MVGFELRSEQACSATCLGLDESAQLHGAGHAGGLLYNVCRCSRAVHVLYSPQQHALSLEVSKCPLWLGRARFDAGGRLVVVGHLRIWLPRLVHIRSLQSAKLERHGKSQVCPLLSLPGLPVSFGQLVVWSSSIDERTPHLFAHCLRDRLRGHPDSLGDRHPPQLFGLPGPGVAMEGAFAQRFGLLDVFLHHGAGGWLCFIFGASG